MTLPVCTASVMPASGKLHRLTFAEPVAETERYETAGAPPVVEVKAGLAGLAFPDAIQALDFLKSEPVALLFLDIHLPRLSGLDFLKTLSNPPHVILTTAFPDYALESYEFNVVDYLLKPFSFQRFVKAVAKVPLKSVARNQEQAEEPPRKEIFIKSGYEHIKIEVDQIAFLRSDADYTEAHVSGKKYLSSDPLRYWEDTFDPGRFARVHKSYIVNTSHIEKVSGNRLYMAGGEIVPVGRAYREAFFERFIK